MDECISIAKDALIVPSEELIILRQFIAIKRIAALVGEKLVLFSKKVVTNPKNESTSYGTNRKLL